MVFTPQRGFSRQTASCCADVDSVWQHSTHRTGLFFNVLCVLPNSAFFANVPIQKVWGFFKVITARSLTRDNGKRNICD